MCLKPLENISQLFFYIIVVTKRRFWVRVRPMTATQNLALLLYLSWHLLNALTGA
jgi:hypothetical protein